MKIFKFLSLLFTIKINFILIMEIESCQITLETDLSSNQSPLLFDSNLKDFIYPNSDDGSIKINPRESIVLACPYSVNTENHDMNIYEITKPRIPVEDKEEISKLDHVSITCKDDKSINLFTVQVNKNIRRTVLLKNIRCRNGPRCEIKQSQASCGKHKETMAFIGFRVKGKFHEIIQFCHDKTRHRTLYAKSKIVKQIKYFQEKVKRDFTQDGYFPNMNLTDTYASDQQLKTITEIVGSKKVAEKIICHNETKFLAKGHLVGKADFVFKAQQLATFTYVNTLPMWQKINGGNWASLEQKVRNYAIDRNRSLEVYTGGMENLKIEDLTIDNSRIGSKLNSQQDLYLFRDTVVVNKKTNEQKEIKSITVPKYIFKVVYHKASESGVAFITINNPYWDEKDIVKYIFCEDVCHRLSWLDTKLKKSFTQSIAKGYTFCCNVVGFRNQFQELPELKISNLLL